MSIFRSLFKELFVKKNKWVYTLLAINLIGAIVLSTIMFFNSYDNFTSNLLLWYAVIAVITMFIYILIGSIQMESDNYSQTWRLAPISDGKFYLTNLLASLANYLYLGLIDIFIGIILAFFSDLSVKNLSAVFNDFGSAINQLVLDLNTINLSPLLILELLLTLILAVSAYQLTIGFIRFTSRSVIDFLPHISNKLVRKLITGIINLALIYLLCTLFSRSSFALFSIYKKLFSPYSIKYISHSMNIHFLFISSSDAGVISMNLLLFVLYNVILGIGNVLLMKYFVEAKQDN